MTSALDGIQYTYVSGIRPATFVSRILIKIQTEILEEIPKPSAPMTKFRPEKWKTTKDKMQKMKYIEDLCVTKTLRERKK